MNCRECASYNRGRGSKACMQCQQYADFKKQFGKRWTVKLESIPSPLYENIPDDPVTEKILEIIGKLPPDLCTIMALRLAGMTNIDIARATSMQLSVPQVQRRVAKSIRLLKSIVRGL